MKVTLVHPSGVRKKVKVGFSWTMLFFGPLVPIFRGDFAGAIRIFLLSLITLGIYGLVACWTYNKKYAQGLLEKGYTTGAMEQLKYFI